jgi:hypothetical protein
MLVLDAVIASARRHGPVEWARYAELYPDPRKTLRFARLRGPFDSTYRWVSSPEAKEASQLEDSFLQWFVDDVQARRWVVRGVRRGEHEAVDIDPILIKVPALKYLRKDDRWELAETVFHAVDVVEGPPPRRKPQPANDKQIHDAIKAECEDCKRTGRKVPNVKEIGEPVQNRLLDKSFRASKKHIQELYEDSRYDGIRGEIGVTVASKRGKRG